MNRHWRSTIRVRLTLLYAGAFLLAGALVVTLMYVYLGQALDRQLTARAGFVERLRVPGPEQGLSGVLIRSPELQEALRQQFQRERDDTLRGMLTWSLASLGAVGVAGGALGWLLAGRALHPLQRIIATARRVADRSLHERIALEGPNDEFKDLADTFDAMLERLDRSFDGQRRFVANASHELRTPLTINRTLIEVALIDPAAPPSTRQLGATLLAVNERHERLIDGLLALAGGEQPITDPVPVDLADVARHTCTEAGDAAGRAGVDLRTSFERAPVAGDPVLLERLAHNLVDNAIRYNIPDDGWVAVTTNVAAGHATLTVENPGPSVPPYEVPALFEPFRRLAATERLAAEPSIQRGAGLGLSIVRSVAQAHGGEVRAEPRAEGGLVVRVRIPA